MDRMINIDQMLKIIEASKRASKNKDDINKFKSEELDSREMIDLDMEAEVLEPEVNIDEFSPDKLEPGLTPPVKSSKECISKSKKKEPKIPLIEQEITINCNESESILNIWSTSKRFWRYMEKMGIEPIKSTSDLREYDLESKHQLVIKKRPAKQARSSNQSFTL